MSRIHAPAKHLATPTLRKWDEGSGYLLVQMAHCKHDSIHICGSCASKVQELSNVHKNQGRWTAPKNAPVKKMQSVFNNE